MRPVEHHFQRKNLYSLFVRLEAAFARFPGLRGLRRAAVLDGGACGLGRQGARWRFMGIPLGFLRLIPMMRFSGIIACKFYEEICVDWKGVVRFFAAEGLTTAQEAGRNGNGMGKIAGCLPRAAWRAWHSGDCAEGAGRNGPCLRCGCCAAGADGRTTGAGKRRRRCHRLRAS